MTKRLMILSLALIVLFGVAPFIAALLASGLAHAFVCGLDQASVHACMVAGVNVGGVLHGMFLLLFYAILTLPLGAVALAVWLVVAIILYFLHRRRQAF
ncbi:MAG: hypothetical protein GC182_14695 [Rhodopseudomonas sp.]|nr:hypothetical protein [Rhodopseudomonas sp.]